MAGVTAGLEPAAQFAHARDHSGAHFVHDNIGVAFEQGQDRGGFVESGAHLLVAYEVDDAGLTLDYASEGGEEVDDPADPGHRQPGRHGSGEQSAHMLAQPGCGRELHLVGGFVEGHPHAEVTRVDVHGLLGDEHGGGDEHQPSRLHCEGVELAEHTSRQQREHPGDLDGTGHRGGGADRGGQGRLVEHSVDGLGIGLDPADLVEDEHRTGSEPAAHIIGVIRRQQERIEHEVLSGQGVVLHPFDELIEDAWFGDLRCGDELTGGAGGESLVDDHRQPQFASAVTISSTVFLASKILSLSTSSIWMENTR